MGTFCLALYIFLFIKLCFSFVFSPINLPPMLLVLFSHELLLVCVAQPYHGRDLLEVSMFYSGAYDLTLVWGSALPDGHPLEQLVLMGGPEYTTCLA
jgi:hypothetical protein